ncbi:glycosyltransferase family 2 protein [cf. Phormidesmis sp. LEGE 11477]|uniref:glycosyltransferase family 2 protein n=1 Tax=cf. Phormidesmis sp. LEGE 11477 TaxID=1828680 RepID=UPI001881DA62|nr:glycosyltransferase family 2 protein [cf. Phormidesmis sp. LEGE 11477]MBE9061255.1 glycosyltransferase family 2 protein [cf. Phormidesmis sp. LEGE 11477]
MVIPPSVSVIINNYNYEQFLPEAINSVLNQAYERVEVIVVDDGSTDGSSQVIADFGDRIQAIFQENGKQAAALNTGFKASSGDIVLFLDADDYLLPDAIQKIVAAFQEGVGKVHFRLRVVDGKDEPLGYSIPSAGMSLATDEVWRQLLQTSSYVSSPMSGNAYLRKTLEPLFPIPDEYKMTADDYLMVSTPFYAGKLASIDEEIGAYRVHDSNQWALTAVSGSRFRRFVKHDLQNFALLRQRAKAFDQKVPEDLERRSLGRIWSRLASLRLEPQEHPVSSDRVRQLVWWGIYAVWHFSSHNLPKRGIYTILFLWVGFMPIPLARLGITWLYAPHLRPKVVDTTLNRLRALVS